MATTAQIASIQQLYVAYFNRPADAAGLDFWAKQVDNGATLDTISATFAATPEYKALFAGLSNDQVVNQIYQNLFNRAPDASGLKFWSDKLTDKALTVDNVVAAVAASAQQDPAAGPDTIAIQSKVAAAVAFTNFLNTDVESRIAYSSGSVNGVGVNYIHSVTNATNLATAIAALPTATQVALETGTVATGTTYALTLNVDTIVGTASNDTINAGVDVTSSVSTLGGLDSIDGGAGIDTLNLTDAVGGKINLTTSSISNVEVFNLTSVTDLANASTDVSGFAGLTQLNVTTAATAGQTFTGATTTAAKIVNSTVQGVTLKGFGGNVSVTTGAAAVVVGDNSSPVAADANAITSAAIKGGTTVSVTDNSGASGAIGAKLTTVTLNGNTGAATLTGDAITAVTVANGVAASDVSIVNTKAHALNLTLNSAVALDVTDTTATSVVLSGMTKASDINLIADKATTLAVTADKNVTLDASTSLDKLGTVTVAGAGVFKANFDSAAALLTKIDASASTGGIDVTITGVNTATTPAAQVVIGSAADDKVTIEGTLGKGGSLTLGAGSDTVAIGVSGVITADAVVDAGDGTDTLLLSIVGSTNVGAFKNFENFDVAGLNTAFDTSILNANNDVANFTGSAAAGASLELQNLATGVGFIQTGDMGTTNVVTLSQATAGAINITANVDEAEDTQSAQVSAASFVAKNSTSITATFDNNNISKLADFANTATLDITGTKATTLTVVSGGSEVVNTLNYTTAASSGTDLLTSIVVKGNQHLVLNETGVATNALASVDASGQTAGGLTFDLARLTSTGTIKLGAGDDIITLDAAGTFTAATDVQKVSGLGLATKEGLTTQDGFDTLTFAASAQAADHTAVGNGYSIADGLYKFGGSGPATLAAAVTELNGNLAANAAVVVQYSGSYYVYSQGATTGAGDDQLVKLVGTTGVHGLDATAAGTIYVF